MKKRGVRESEGIVGQFELRNYYGTQFRRGGAGVIACMGVRVVGSWVRLLVNTLHGVCVCMCAWRGERVMEDGGGCLLTVCRD